MNTAPGLLRFLRALSQEASERRLLAAASVALIRQRRRAIRAVAPLLARLPAAGQPKLVLWSELAAAWQGRPLQREFAPEVLLPALRGTQAYKTAQQRLGVSASGLLFRGRNYSHLLKSWRQRPVERLLIFHHYDQRALLPQSWFEALLAIQQHGWQVLLSTSGLEPVVIEQLKSGGVEIAQRSNIGLCLGAYRDLSLLLSDPAAARGLHSLVLCNDSNLPLRSPTALLSQLQAWTDTEEASAEPVLAGLTDSAQRACYHLQSFFLYANRALLQHPAWLRFWLGFSLDGTKDDLINRGEIGLSQAMLAAGVQLRPTYPLVQGLLADPAMAEELQRYGIWQPRHVNQSLFAWQSLLARGFPLVKKHVLFELIENQGLPMAMAELARWIPEERRELLAADLQQLFVSRYSGGEPEM